MTEEETKCHWALGLFLCYFATNWVLRVQKHKCTKHFETQIHHSTCIRRLPTLLFWPFSSLHCTLLFILRSNPKFYESPQIFYKSNVTDTNMTTIHLKASINKALIFLHWQNEIPRVWKSIIRTNFFIPHKIEAKIKFSETLKFFC